MAEKIPKYRWGYRNESFDKLLALMLANMTEQQKELIPIDIRNKIFKSADPNIGFLLDAQKDYILTCALDKTIVKVVLDLENGLSIQQFAALRDSWRLKKRSGVNASVIGEKMITEGEFILAGKDLYDAFQYQALLCYSPLFKVLLNTRKEAKKYKHVKGDMSVAMSSIIEMLTHYESNRKRIVMDFGLADMSEWYALLHFYNSEKKGSSLYKSSFLYAYNSNKKALQTATTNLKTKGLLYSRGSPKVMMTSITPKGKALVDRIIIKYALSY